MSDVVDRLVGQYNSHLSSVLPRAVGSNLVLWSTVSIATVIVFNILRPRNKIIYEPKVKYHVGDKKPPPIKDGFFSWVSPLIHVKEDQLLDKIGLDAVTYLRFLRMMRWMFLCVAVLTCAVLIPVNITYNFKNVPQQRRNILSILTIQDVTGNILILHISMSYAITALVLGYLYYNWRHMIRLRRNWFRSDEYVKSFYARTLIVLDVPRKLQSDDGIHSLFANLRMPYPTTSVHIGRRVGKLPELVEEHNEVVRSFEQVLVRYLKGGKLGKKRPTITEGGFMGCGGIKKDAIQHYTQKLIEAERKVQAYREKTESNKVEAYGFASLAAVPYAHIVAQRLDGKHPEGTTITLAPNPKDIIWKNLNLTPADRSRQRTFGWIWLAVVCAFNTVPLLFISLLANLTHVAAFWPLLDDWRVKSEWSFALVNGILPPTIAAIFGFFLPKVMRWLSRYQGAITHSRLDRAVVARYFAFLVISQLFIFSLLGVLFGVIKDVMLQVQANESFIEIIKKVPDLAVDVQAAYISQAPYWLTYFPLRGFLAVFDLAQLLNVIWIWIRTRLFGRTPRDIRDWTQPPEFEFAIYYSNLLFMATVALVYAPLAPLVTLAAAVVFWLSSIVYKYQLMFVFVSKVESGGRLWNMVCNRMLVSVVLMQLLMTLTISLQRGWGSYYWAACLPPILLVAAFKVFIIRPFTRQFRHYMPTDAELASATVHSERADNKGNRLEKRFGHPALHADLFTPMLHAKMMPLLQEVYHGRLGKESTTLQEYGGQKYDAQIAPGGIKIASVEQGDLEYDPALYQRDRGELDWDARSIASTTVLGDGASTLHHSKSGFYASESRLQPTGYAQYLQRGPVRSNTSLTSGQGYEMSQFDSKVDLHAPLLASRSTTSLHQPMDHGMQDYGHQRNPSSGPAQAYGRSITPSPLAGPGEYFPQPPVQQHQQYPPHQRSPSSGPNEALNGYQDPRYHQRNPSAGPNDAYAQYSAQPQHYAPRSHSPGPQRAMTPTSYPVQRQPSPYGVPEQPRGRTPPGLGSGRNTPEPYGGWAGPPGTHPNTNNMAGRGANRTNY